MKKKLIFLELNELNFDLIKKYIDIGELPNFKNIFERYKYSRTTSESKYENIEPWIQWVTAHTGKDFNQHNIFHLNESNKLKFPQIWEELENKNLSVSALFPMNGKNNLKKSNNIFIPDPWSDEKINGGLNLQKIHFILSFFVNNNSSKRINIKNFINLFFVFLTNFKFKNIFFYMKYFFLSFKKKWFRVLFLELFIFDIFLKINSKNFNFISIFFNGSAHIQHHYLNNSKVLNDAKKNPNWYLKKENDPILDIYKMYDKIIIKKLLNYLNSDKDLRVMMLTGLTQDPVTNPVFYYRLSDPKNFISLFKINNFKIASLMSRDFSINFEDEINKNKFIEIFKKLNIKGLNLFELKIYGNEIFVTLSYDIEIKKHDEFIIDDINYKYIDYFNFVAIKNGKHNGNGFLLDSKKIHFNQPLSEVKSHVLDYFK